MGQEMSSSVERWYRSILGMSGALDVVLAESSLNEPEAEPCCLAVVGEEHPGHLTCVGCKLAVCERHSANYVAGRFCDGCVREGRHIEAGEALLTAGAYCTCGRISSRDLGIGHALGCPMEGK